MPEDDPANHIHDADDKESDEMEEQRKKVVADEKELKEKQAALVFSRQIADRKTKAAKNNNPQPSHLQSDDLEISAAVWDAIKSGEMIKYIANFLSAEDKKKLKDPEIKISNPNLCELWNNKEKILEISWKEGCLGVFVVTSNTSEDSIAPIPLMIATARVAVELEINARLGDLSDLSTEEQKAKRDQLLEANPNILHFTIDRFAKPQDVVDMLLQMKQGELKLTATLTDDVIDRIQKEMNPLDKTIKEQIDVQRANNPKIAKKEIDKEQKEKAENKPAGSKTNKKG